ncbi:MAG: hypothetical protein QOJ38_957 [Solirubrobacterales bacterium]|jgi:hypothetical protein|nr:hypothetical protein [Solirubrobacterales bacterium]
MIDQVGVARQGARRQLPPTVIVAAALIVAAIAMVSGCGGSAAKPAGASAPTGDAAKGTPQAKRDALAAKTALKAKQQASHGQTSATARPHRLTRKEIQRRLDTIPLAKKNTFAQAAVLAILKSFGFPHASAVLSSNGHLVVVTIPRQYACEADPAQVPKVKKQLKKVILFAHRIDIGVANNGGPLESYVRNHCPKLTPPTASGGKVYDNEGTGLRGSPELNITANRWTVSYENQGGAFELYVTSGKKLVDYVKTDKRGVGKLTLKGPGKFHVTVSGAGNWAVKVYDGT